MTAAMPTESGLVRRARYMLRRNLPLWKPEITIDETIDFCLDVGVDEVIWKVDAEEFNHGFTPHDLIHDYLVWIAKAKALQLENGIVFSINPWLTLNHVGRARYPDGPPPGFRWRVSPEGAEAIEMACPLAPGWREWLLEAYRLYAITRPDKLWIEDDFKTFAFRPDFMGCFCDAHLKAFGDQIGEKIGREALVERLVRPGEPDHIRARWLDYQGAVMVQICRELEQVVHRESPNTRLGLMGSWSTDGRWWADALKALAGPLRPLARTSLAWYEEGRAPEFLPDRVDILKETECLAEDTENCPELENSQYTSYSKSARVTRLQIVESQVLGNNGITMNLFDMLGSAITVEPRLRLMLKDLKPMLDGIASVAETGGRPRGISIPYPKRYADTAHADPENGFTAFSFDGDGWCASLQGSGIPIVYNGDGMVTAITGQTVRALETVEIERLLKGGLLLDGSAAAVLAELGYGPLIGVEVDCTVDRNKLLMSAERDDWAVPSDQGPVYMSLRCISGGPGTDDYLYPLTLLPSGRTTSVFVDPAHSLVMPGMVVFENDLGGRVAVYPFDLSNGTGAGFMNWHRRSQLQRLVRWLGRGHVDLFVDGGAWMMPVRRDYEGYVFIAVLNFETDDWDGISFTLECPTDSIPESVDVLTKTGSFESVQANEVIRDGANVRICLPVHVNPLDFVVLRICNHKGEEHRVTTSTRGA